MIDINIHVFNGLFYPDAKTYRGTDDIFRVSSPCTSIYVYHYHYDHVPRYTYNTMCISQYSQLSLIWTLVNRNIHFPAWFSWDQFLSSIFHITGPNIHFLNIMNMDIYIPTKYVIYYRKLFINPTKILILSDILINFEKMLSFVSLIIMIVTGCI